MDAKWYILQVRSNSEDKIVRHFKKNLEAHNLLEHLVDCKIPSQIKTVIRKGKKVDVMKKILPGYIMLKITDDEKYFESLCNIALETEGAKKFLGSSNKPTPMTDEETSRILEQIEIGKVAQEVKQSFSIGDNVVIRDGNSGFDGFNGAVEIVDNEKKQVTITVKILGRDTTIELPFHLVKLT